VDSAPQAYRPECDPARVGAQLDRLWAQRRDYPQPPEGSSPDWSVIAEWHEWRIGWYEAFRVQYARLGGLGVDHRAAPGGLPGDPGR
jgi:hypothetical protein